MNLYPYQSEFISEIRHALPNNKKAIACLATGGGKSVVMFDIVNKSRTTTFVITESKKIFNQLIKYDSRSVAINADSNITEIEQGKVYVCMMQTLLSRPNLMKQVHGLVLVDECHIGTGADFLKELDAYVIGFTATPIGEHLREIYSCIVVGPQTPELISMGFLTPYRHYERKRIDASKLVLRNGEFTEESQLEAFGNGNLYAGLREDLERFKPNKAVIFCSSIEHCDKLHAEFPESVSIHTKNKNNEADLAKFMTGSVNLCFSVGQLSKGWDFNKIDFVGLMRATTSVPLLIQMIGRGGRIFAPKKEFICVDYGLNGTRLGKWDDMRDWQNLWNAPKKKRKDILGVVSAKLCPNCEAMLSASARVCMYCNAEIPKTKKELIEGELQELISSKPFKEFTAFDLAQWAKLTDKKSKAIGIAKGRGLDYLKEFGKHMGYSGLWARTVINKRS